MIDPLIFNSFLDARAAADYLVRHGILAAPLPPVDSGLTSPQFRVLLADARLRDRAAELLKEMLTEEPAATPGWEDGVRLDLSRLPPSVVARCAKCGYSLQGLGSVGRCTECGETFDAAARIVAEYGPEALEPCCPLDPDEAAPLDDAALRAMEVLCAECGYSLRGLNASRLCPECGRAYDKRRFVDEFQEQLLGMGRRALRPDRFDSAEGLIDWS